MPHPHFSETFTPDRQESFAGPRRVLGGLATAAGMAAAIGVGGFVAGITSPVETEVAPHRATVELALPKPWLTDKANKLANNEQLSADFGPLGTLYTATPLRFGHFNIGAHIVIKEIPSTDGASWATTQVAYEQFLSEAGRASTAETIKHDILEQGIAYGGLSAGTAFALFMFAKPRRRATNVLRSKWTHAAVIGAYSAMALTGSAPIESGNVDDFRGNDTLAAAGLPGVEVEGLLLETGVNTHLQKGIEEVRKYDASYKAIKQNFDTAFDAKLAEEEKNSTELHTYLTQNRITTLLWTSDIHCNVGMMDVAAHIANRQKVAGVIDSGDITMGGTAAEKPCVAIFRQRVNKDIPIAEGLGNHDDRVITGNQVEELGYINLNGQVKEFAGLRIFGYPSPMRSKFGAGYHNDSDHSLTQLGEKAATEACAAGNIAIAVMHEPVAGEQTAKDGCAWLTLSGHTHQPAGPFAYETKQGTDAATSYMFINGTTGGAAPNKLTLSRDLGQNATTILLHIDTDTQRPVGYRVITIQPDKKVIVGDLLAFGPLPVKTPPEAQSVGDPLARPTKAPVLR